MDYFYLHNTPGYGPLRKHLQWMGTSLQPHSANITVTNNYHRYTYMLSINKATISC